MKFTDLIGATLHGYKILPGWWIQQQSGTYGHSAAIRTETRGTIFITNQRQLERLVAVLPKRNIWRQHNVLMLVHTETQTGFNLSKASEYGTAWFDAERTLPSVQILTEAEMHEIEKNPKLVSWR